MLPAVHFETLGCRLNQDETEGAAAAFREAGFPCTMGGLSASSLPRADVALSVLNTCTVTGKAEQKARRLIRLMLSAFPRAVVLVTGCYAELDGEAVQAICPERVAVVPGRQKQLLAPFARDAAVLLSRFCSGGAPDAAAVREAVLCRAQDGLSPGISGAHARGTAPLAYSPSPVLSPFTLYTRSFQQHSRATLKVQDGCDCSCSYCRICLARGPSVSLPAAEAVRRIRELEAAGLPEAVLTGVNLSQYADGGIRLGSLLSLLLSETSDIRIRLSSLYPQSVDDSLCVVLSDPRVQPFFHLSIQSGSPDVLSRMRRPHSVRQVTEALSLLRGVKDDPFISCDIIAGFPGETDADFSLTQELCVHADFAWIHAFPFSARPGTPARDMPDQVDARTKALRVDWLTRTACEGKLSYIRRQEGKTVHAVLENRPGELMALTENYLHVRCTAGDGIRAERGKPCRVVIGRALEDSVRGGGEADCAGTIALRA